VFHPGSSIKAAHSSNRLILALESDAKLFDEVLKPLQTPPPVSKALDSTTTCDGMEIDDDSPIEDVELLDLCE
jgi:hypothetical protein